MMVSRADANTAFTLITLLEMHCKHQDQWENHYDMIFEGSLTKAQEAKSYEQLTNAQRPFLQLVASYDFEYQEILDIIPPNFNTDKASRAELLDELKAWADVEYDMEIPF